MGKPVARSEVVRVGPGVDRTSPEWHKSIFWDVGRGQKDEVWQECCFGHYKASDLIRRLDVVRVGLECLRTVFWVIGRG